MFRSTRDSSNRRASLLATSALVASSILGGGAVLAVGSAPTLAWAASCTPIANGETGPGSGPGLVGFTGIICSTDDTGIDYTGAGDNTITITNGAGVTTFGVSIEDNIPQLASGLEAVVVDTSTVPGGVINSAAGTGITVDTSAGDGIFIQTGSFGAGAQAGSIVAGGDTGIHADVISGTGSVTIDALNNVSGVTGRGIEASTTGGAITIQTGTAQAGPVRVSTSNTGLFAIRADIAGGTGALNISTDGIENSGIGTTNTGSGATNITVNGNITVAGGVAAINSSSVGLETINIDGLSALTTANGGPTINVTAANGVTINTAVGTVVASTGGTGIQISGSGGTIGGMIAGTVTGDYAVSLTQTGAGAIDPTYSGVITGTNGAINQVTVSGVNEAILDPTAVVTSTGGVNPAVNITSTTGDVIVFGDAGSDVEQGGLGGGINAATGGAGFILVDSAGTIGLNAPVGGVGIKATIATGGTGTATVASNIVNATGTGVDILNSGSGGSTADIDGALTSTAGIGVNVQAIGGGAATVNDNSTITSEFESINASGTGAGLVKVDATFGGAITSTASDGIDAASSGTGGVSVTTGANATIAAFGDGILAQDLGTTGGITVTQGADIGTGVKAVGFNGILAEITNASNGGNVLVTSNANVFAGGQGVSPTFGVAATTTGVGSVTINALAGKTVDAATYGMYGVGAGGPVKINTNDTITADTGIHAANLGAGAITVLYNGGTITALGGGGTAGNGIEAITTGDGLVQVGTASARITGVINATAAPTAEGIRALSGGFVNVFTGAATISGNATDGIGIFALDQAAITSGVLVDAAGSTISGATGIFASNAGLAGGDTTTVNTDAATNVTSTSGDGIEALGQGGLVTVLNNGTVTTTGGAGIDAANHNGTNTDAGNVDVNGSGAITVSAGGGAGILVRSDLGNETVGDLGGGYNGAIDLQDNANGIDAQIIVATSTGNVSVTTGAGGTIGTTLGDSTFNGILASTNGLGSVTVSAAGSIGNPLLPGGPVHNTGITAQIANANNLSNVTVNVGPTMSIFAQNDGIFATTSGEGNVTVNDNTTGILGSVTGNGIHATYTAGKGTGTVTVNQTAGQIITLANDGIVATSNANGGNVFVNQGATATITATGGDGIDASETGGHNGNVGVDLNGATSATGIGVFATTNTNDDVTVTLENGSSVLGGRTGLAEDGVLATDTNTDGQVTVNLLGNAHIGTGTAVGAAAGGNGVEVNSTGKGAIAVNTDAGTNIWAIGDGILADETFGVALQHSDDLVITAHGSIHSGATGIDAEVTKATNNAAVNVTAGNINSVLNGVTANTIGGGNVTVTTDAGTAIVSTTGDGILASSSGGNGNVEVTNNGTVSGDPGIVVIAVGTGTATEIANASVTGTKDAIQITSVDGLNTTNIHNAGTVIESTGTGDGIDATTTGKGSISITTDTGTSVVGGTSTATAGATDGIFAKVGGSGIITVEVAGSVTTQAPTVSWGIQALGNGGLVSITLDPTGAVLDGGINAVNTTTVAGNGNVNVALNGGSTVNNSSGDGVLVVVDNGAINVQGAAGTDITSASAGIDTLATGTGAITINDQGAIGAGLDAIEATTNTGAISVTTGAGAITGGSGGIITSIFSGTASTTITTGPGLVTGVGGQGIDAVTGGTGNVTLTTGPVTGDVGINTATNGAGVTNITANGTVTGTGLDGIDATDNAGSGAITITTAAVSAVNGTDINASSTGGGSIIVTTNGALTGTAGVRAVTNGAGSVNVHDKSTVTATGGLGVNAVAGTGGATVTTDGLVKGVGGIFASSAGAGSTQVTVNGGVDGTTGAGGVGVQASSGSGNVTVAANGGAADTIKGTTGVSTSTGGAGITTITTTGLVTGTTADGIDATTTGSGLIDISTGAVTAAGAGIKANSTTGAANIIIDATGAVNAVTGGIVADNHLGAGSINITDLAITTTGGPGVNATAGSGGVIVTANGPVSAAGGVGINATAAGAGGVQVITGKAGSVTSTTSGGITTTGVTGPITVTTNNTVTGQTNGITASTGGAGTINIDTTGGGLVTGITGDGIDATAGSGAILIQTVAVTGGVNGISALGATAPITITTNGPITGGGTGAGIKAVTAGAGTIQINVLTGAVSAGTGIFTAQTGTGVTNIVDSLAANTITGTTGDGIQSVNGAGTGAVNVGGGTGSRIEAAVSGATNGIDISGAGPMNVFTDANVTGAAGWGIKAVSTAAPVTVNVTTGTIQGSASGGVGGGILAKSGSTAANAVTVTSTTTVIGLKAGSNGIDAEDTTTGNVVVADTGPSVTGANDAIFAKSVGGTITVGTTAAPITSTIGDATTLNAGIETSNTTGTTSIVTAASATINDPNAIFGIEANSTTGGIAITSASAIGTAGNGINAAGIFALSTGANTAGISITNTGAIFVDNTAAVGGGGVAPGSFGIFAVNAGTGLVTVTNSGVIDPPNYGIWAGGGGAVNITNTANVTANLTALRAESVGGGVVTVTSNGAATQLTGTAVDGIDAFSVGAGNGSVTVGVSDAAPITSNITAGLNGVDAEGNGVVGVWTSGTITGTFGTGIIAASTPGAFAGATVTVSTQGAITDTRGIVATSNGSDPGDTVTVRVGANVTATNGNGVDAEGVNGLTSIALNAGNVSANAGDGLRAASSGTGGITVTTAAGTDVSATDNDIDVHETGASGAVTVTSNGTLNATGAAGNDGIFAGVFNSSNTSAVTINENGGDNATHDAIRVLSDGKGAITVNVNGSAIGGANGVYAQDTNAADPSGVTVNVAGVTVEGKGAGGFAIEATTAGTGNVTVAVANGATILDDPTAAAAGSGIIATNTGTAGNVTVTTGNGVIGTAGNPVGTDGINAQITKAANAGTVTVTNNSAITMANGSDAGIKAISAGTGNVTVNNNGVIDPAKYGIYASSGGNATVNNTASVTGLTGIHADTGGAATTASVNDTNLAPVTGTTANGIEALGTAGGNVTVNTSFGGNITGGTNGIDTTVTGGTGVTMINTLTGTTATGIIVTGNGGDGILATSSGSGAIGVSAGNVTGQGAAGNASVGVAASSTGGGNVTVATTGNILGNSATDVQGGGFAGVEAASSGGNGIVSVMVGAPSNAAAVVQGGAYGILASSGGTGSTTVLVAANDPVTAMGAGTAAAPSALNGGTGPVGIEAIGGSGGGAVGAATGVTVGTAAAPISSNITAAGGRAIVTSSANNALITIGAGVTVKGLGDATTAFGGPAADTKTHAVVDVSSVTGAVTTINNSGTIELVAGPAISSYGDLAITAATTGAPGVTIGGVTVNNKGVILGRVQLQGETKSDNVIINNTGTWHTTGIDTLGGAAIANAETITNSGLIGTAANSVATFLNFGAGANLITNTGVIVAGESPLGGVTSGTPATPAVTTITGAVTFNNNGVIIMGNAGGSTSASDGLIDSTIEAAATTLGGTGLIDLDANLWSDQQSPGACASSVLTAADCLVIGASAGNEGIRVTDTKAHALGAFNPIGIVIVDGATNAGANFHLDSGSTWFNPGGTNQFGGATNVLAKPGLFFYDLAYDAATKTERLIGVPEAAAFEFASVGGAVNDLWYTTTQTWFDRQADLRDGIDGKAVGSGPGVWLKMVGDWSNRSRNDVFTDFNKTYVFNVTYDQDTAAIIGGLDLLNVTHKNEAWVVGIDGGAVDSSIDFRASPDRFHLSGANVGGYATYLSGGLYVDGTITANLLNMQASLPQLQTTPNPWTTSDHVTSFGGQVEAGYAMPLGDMLFWEPLGILSYANTTLGPLAVPGGVQNLGHDDSFRGSLGARVGATADFQYYKVKLTITGRVWDEFSNDTLSTLIVPGGANFLNNDNLKGVFGEISGQVNLFTLNSGLSAFATGGVKFKSAYTEGTMTLGARYQF